MDFILSLTHFCEVHGPTSVLCSQVVPATCAQCDLDPAASDFSSSSSSSASNNTSFSSTRHGTSPSPDLRFPAAHKKGARRKPSSHERSPQASEPQPAAASARSIPTAADVDLPPGSAPAASVPQTAQRIEDLPGFLGRSFGRTDHRGSAESRPGFGGGEGDTCASCRLRIPEGVSKQLPPGAPGTLEDDGKVRNGSPVLRSREMVHSCSGNHTEHDDSHASHASHTSHVNQYSSSPSSDRSSYAGDASCHPHIMTYLSLRGPPTPSDYALLRRASIRTLSCELLPRGLSSGPLSFGDSVAGYTIAYVFRLPDTMARGKRRSYALVALAGKDSGRAFRACPVIWRVFGRIASGLVGAAEKHQESEKAQEDGSNNNNNNTNNNAGSSSGSANIVNGRRITPISSFLTGRMVDPDGQPRRAGQVRARNLTEIVGNEYIFAELHAQFVALLQQLGAMLGGVRVPDPRSSVTSGTFDEAGNGYFATHSSSTTRDAKDAGNAAAVNNKADSASTGQSRVRNDASPSLSSPSCPPVNVTASPKPIPISQRRQVAAT